MIIRSSLLVAGEPLLPRLQHLNPQVPVLELRHLGLQLVPPQAQLDDKQETTVGFLLRTVAWFDGQGISGRRVLSDNGSAYRSKPWREASSALGLISKRTRPNSPQTNGKAERFIKTLLAEWAYSMAFQTSTERNRWLPRYLAIYNGRRCHMALAGRTPFQQLGLLRATE